MAEFEGVARKIGDSIGILIPRDVVKKANIRPKKKVRIVIPETIDWSKIWGQFHSEVPTQELLRRARTERD